jgi:pimeloyl-ACP methyl ester carboxylesterase
MVPETRYAKSGDVNIAYQVVGDGPLDLVHVPGWVSNVEAMWEQPTMATLLGRLASFSRLILFDKRGTGLSDRVPNDQLPTLEQRMDDVRAVLDATGSERTALFGHSEGGNMCVLFAATYPERTTALVTLGVYAKRIRSDDYPWAPTAEEREANARDAEERWGRLSARTSSTTRPAASGTSRSCRASQAIFDAAQVREPLRRCCA